MDSINHVFQYCANCDSEILSKCPSTDQTKYTSIGILIVLIAVFAATAGGYAVNLSTGNSAIALIFGLLWGCFIFNMDRLLVGSIQLNDDSLKNKLKTLFVRFLLALMISIAISHVIALKIFEPELNARYNQERKSKLNNHRLKAGGFKPSAESADTGQRPIC